MVDYTLTNRQRAAVERLERLADFIVAELDRIYGDPDLEDGGDGEPVLAASETVNQTHWSEGFGDDRELSCEDEGAQCDDEGHDSDRERGADDEGDAQATCHWFFDHPTPWPPLPRL